MKFPKEKAVCDFKKDFGKPPPIVKKPYKANASASRRNRKPVSFFEAMRKFP